MDIDEIIDLLETKIKKSIFPIASPVKGNPDTIVVKVTDIDLMIAEMREQIKRLMVKLIDGQFDEGMQTHIAVDNTIIQTNIDGAFLDSATREFNYLQKGVWDNKKFVEYLFQKFPNSKIIVIMYGDNIIK